MSNSAALLNTDCPVVFENTATDIFSTSEQGWAQGSFVEAEAEVEAERSRQRRGKAAMSLTEASLARQGRGRGRELEADANSKFEARPRRGDP